LSLHREIEHGARGVALGEHAARHDLVALAGVVAAAGLEVVVLILERVGELVGEREGGRVPGEVLGDVHGARLRVVEAVELGLEQLRQLAHVVERRGREAHELHHLRVALDGRLRVLVVGLLADGGDELGALEHPAGHGRFGGEAADGAHLLEDSGDALVLGGGGGDAGEGRRDGHGRGGARLRERHVHERRRLGLTSARRERRAETRDERSSCSRDDAPHCAPRRRAMASA
jgi:hypothetical protein